MISVVIPTLDDEAVIGRALRPLVTAAVAGLVREVIVADGGSSDATVEIADDAGCRILPGSGTVEARARAAAASARGDWVMILDPRAQLLPGWERAVRDHIDHRPGQAAFMPSLDPDGGSILKRIAGLFRRAEPVFVLIVRREAYAAGGEAGAPRRLEACAVVLRGAN